MQIGEREGGNKGKERDGEGDRGKNEKHQSELQMTVNEVMCNNSL